MSAPPPLQALPAELAEALAAVGLRARAAWPITTLTSPLHTRAVYRLELESGETIKARRLEDEPTVQALCALRAAMPPAFVPVRAAHGRVLFEPWVDGTDLRGVPPTAEILRAAGALLAALHGITTVAGRLVRGTQPTPTWRAFGKSACARIGRHGALDAPALEGLRRALARLDPGTAVCGLVHSDFCGDNFVVDARGALHVIDNERIAVDALGYDHGRTWVRWNLDEADWECFAAAYAAHGGPVEALAALPFWRLVASLSAAIVRLDFGMPAPLSTARLDALVAELV